MLAYEAVKDFLDYLEYYPDVDEPGYDGIHEGGWKGLREDAPENAKKAYEKYKKIKKEAERQGKLL